MIMLSAVNSNTVKGVPLYELASIIRREYGSRRKSVPAAAAPYVEAMSCLSSMDDRYVTETGHDIVPYALSNLGTWKGDIAKTVKDELRSRLK